MTSLVLSRRTVLSGIAAFGASVSMPRAFAETASGPFKLDPEQQK
jgi:hypothetical protein